MKFYLITFLVFSTQFCVSSNIIIPTNNDIQELLSEKVGIQNGSDIIVENPGLLNVILDRNELIFEVCSSGCNADFLVCYEADSVGQNVLKECDSKCGFNVSTRGDRISFMNDFTSNTGKPKVEGCDMIKMAHKQTPFRGAGIPSCSPKIENGIVKLDIQNASSECPVLIKNALIIPKTITSSSPTTTSSFRGQHGDKNINGSSGSETTENSGFFENYWWIFLIIAVVIIIITVAVIVFCCRRNRTTKKQTAPLPPRRLQGSKSPIVLQPSTETTHDQKRQIPTSLMQPSSIISRKSLLLSKKEIKSEETDLTSMKPTA